MNIQLDRPQKIAFARIMSDLIEADFIVEESEISMFEDIKDKYHISDCMLTEARSWTFADAIDTLSELKEYQKKCLLDELEAISMSDGTCVPLEAIQMVAVRYALLRGCKVFSVAPSLQTAKPNSTLSKQEVVLPSQEEDNNERTVESVDYNLCGITINHMDVVYVDNQDSLDNPVVNDENFQIISDRLSLGGYNFVYVPHIARDFASLGDVYLRKVIRYMIPDVVDDEVQNIAYSLATINTKRFCRDLLYKKIGIDLTNMGPSFLIKISESYVVRTHNTTRCLRTPFSNFLLLRCSDNAISDIDTFVRCYMNMLNCSVMVESKPPTRRFLYTGFHKTLFDLIAYVEEKQEYQLVIDRSKFKITIYFKPKKDGKIIEKLFDDREATLYLMITYKSMRGGKGLDWFGKANRRQELIKEYHRLYTGKGQEREDYIDRVHISKIKKKISSCGYKMANVSSFLPVNDRGKNYSYYRINALDEDVIIIE